MYGWMDGERTKRMSRSLYASLQTPPALVEGLNWQPQSSRAGVNVVSTWKVIGQPMAWPCMKVTNSTDDMMMIHNDLTRRLEKGLFIKMLPVPSMRVCRRNKQTAHVQQCCRNLTAVYCHS